MFNKRVLVHNTIQVSASDVGPRLDVEWGELPAGSTRKSWNVHTLRDVDGLCQLVDVFQRTLDTVEDAAKDTWTQFYGEWLACSENRIAYSYT